MTRSTAASTQTVTRNSRWRDQCYRNRSNHLSSGHHHVNWRTRGDCGTVDSLLWNRLCFHNRLGFTRDVMYAAPVIPRTSGSNEELIDTKNPSPPTGLETNRPLTATAKFEVKSRQFVDMMWLKMLSNSTAPCRVSGF